MPEFNLFTDFHFHNTCQVLDSQMKSLEASGKFERKSANVITEEVENQLWECNVLVDHTPKFC